MVVDAAAYDDEVSSWPGAQELAQSSWQQLRREDAALVK
jgi:hypothetical protein